MLRWALAARQECGDFWHGYVGEFLRFEFVKPAAVHVTFAEEAVGRNGIEHLPNAAGSRAIAWARVGVGYIAR